MKEREREREREREEKKRGGVGSVLNTTFFLFQVDIMTYTSANCGGGTQNENLYKMDDAVAFELRIQVTDLPSQGLSLTDLSTPNFMLPFQDVPEKRSCNDLVNENFSPGKSIVCYFSVSKKQVIETMGAFQQEDQQAVSKGSSAALTAQGDAAVFEISAAFGCVKHLKSKKKGEREREREREREKESDVRVCLYMLLGSPALW